MDAFNACTSKCPAVDSFCIRDCVTEPYFNNDVQSCAMQNCLNNNDTNCVKNCYNNYELSSAASLYPAALPYNTS